MSWTALPFVHPERAHTYTGYQRGDGVPEIHINFDQDARLFTVRVHTNGADSGSGKQLSRQTEGSSEDSLGLTVCGRIVDQFGGRIWVQPESGESSVFFVALASDESAPVDYPSA